MNNSDFNLTEFGKVKISSGELFCKISYAMDRENKCDKVFNNIVGNVMKEINIETQENETEAQRLGRMTRYLRSLTGMKREEFANYLHIPLGTVRDWEQGKRKMPEYVYELMEYKVENEILNAEKKLM